MKKEETIQTGLSLDGALVEGDEFLGTTGAEDDFHDSFLDQLVTKEGSSKKVSAKKLKRGKKK